MTRALLAIILTACGTAPAVTPPKRVAPQPIVTARPPEYGHRVVYDPAPAAAASAAIGAALGVLDALNVDAGAQ